MARHYRNGDGSGSFAKLALLFVVVAALLFVLCRLYPQSFPGGVVSAVDAVAERSLALISGIKTAIDAPGGVDKPETPDTAGEAPDAGETAASQDEAASSDEPPQPDADDRPMLAIVIDDGGESLAMARQAAALDVPLTWAIMPFRTYTKKTAALADVKGAPYLLHLPMQAESDKDKKEYLVGEGMTPEEIRIVTSKCLDELPRAIGINNHRGSLATSKREIIAPVIDELKSRGLIFMDSRTSGKSVAYDTARAVGIKAVKNGGFLDNTADKDAIAARFAEAVKQARKNGGCVVICHFRPATMLFLKKLNAEYKSLPVRLTTLPEMLSERQEDGDGQ